MAYEVSTSSSEPVHLAIKDFMQSFYATSDNPIEHDLYAQKYFTPDATLIMGGKRATGFDGTLLPLLSFHIYIHTTLRH